MSLLCGSLQKRVDVTAPSPNLSHTYVVQRVLAVINGQHSDGSWVPVNLKVAFQEVDAFRNSGTACDQSSEMNLGSYR